ncbi:SusC/RagA family TonB-linked outer membrane protein [Dyadobacter sp. CY312]|uniref:SusC/RagA family TonB-linked outer membrane protein n=1 Tax=Dyadobacter sp. CY312 TaxID=2907303 RepID=UPI001F397383|nr:SusC/RagA family TonB-linked outer membrane protein [Dyadobacter sp. CY312]MCE7044083.1 SusC/RagA family TonB-linked outer membrane protein [Dyadobacter sp. CY312]
MKKKLLLLQIFLLTSCTVLLAQQTVIKGKVTDNSGGELPGVNVVLKGNTSGTSTDQNGEYSLSLPNGSAAEQKLVFSFIGYVKQEIAIANRNVIDVKLLADEQNLDEVVVVGYGTTAKKNLTTAISKVDPTKIPTSANNNISELLFGRAAGLQVTQQSSQPGGNISVSIRGKGNPLLVIDGVVYPGNSMEPSNGSVEIQGVNRGGLAGLNPNDIESIEFLKDASAAIYGVSAANGVMIITTKKGKAGRMSVSYDGSRSFSRNMPYLKPLNASDYMLYFNQLNVDKYQADRNMAPFGTVPADLSGYTQKFTDEQIRNAGEGTDWLGQVLRPGSVDNHNVSVNGGTEKATYFFSGNYFNQVGSMKKSDLTRFSGRLNVNFVLSKIFRLNVNVNANRNAYSNPQAGWQAGGSGTQGFNALQAALAYPSSVPVYNADGTYSQFAQTGNPVSLLDIKDKTKAQGLLANTSLDIDIIPNVLTAKLLYGNNSEYSIRDFYIPVNVFWGQLYKARASLAETRRQNQTMEATMSYKKSFGDWLNLDVVTGVGQYLEDFSGFSVETSDMQDAINTDNLASATGPKVIGSYRGVNKLRSFFIRSNFDFLDRYLLSLTVRRDGADKFFPDNKYQYFPSVSAGWKINNEAFMQGIQTISTLKLRASYGMTGERPGSVAYGAYGADPNAVTFNNGSAVYFPYRLTAFDNPNLRWPITKTFNAGLDFGLFKERITGSVDVFTEDRTRLLSSATTQQLSIISTSPINGGHQRRKGFEFTINTENIKTKNFNWNTTLNVTHFKNRWVERFPNDPPAQYGNVNDPVGGDIIYVYQTNGILQAGQEVPTWQPASARKPGNPIFVDNNGDGKLDFNDVKSYSGIPKAIVGFGNNFTYGKFDLSVFFYGQYGAWGNDFTTLWGDPVSLLSSNQSGTERIKDAWSTSNPTGTLPGAAYNEGAIALDAGLDTRLVKRDFLRCRNITLGYTINSGGLTKYISSVRFFADVQNAFILTGFKGVDPEIQASSTKGGPAPYPMVRTLSLGLRANF